MALRILSGVITPKESNRSEGEAKIQFFPLKISGDVEQPAPEELRSVGANGEFVARPCKMVALREITVRDTDTASLGEGSSSHDEHWAVGDEIGTDNRDLTVRWRARKDARIREISYMVVGEVVREVG